MNLRARPRLRVLVTGFGPFPGVTQNASAAVVRHLVGQAALPAVEVFAEVIPVEWAEAKTVAREAIARVNPHAILHFGVAKRAAGFEIETRAFNMSGPKLDRAGFAQPGRPLDRSGAPVLHATLPPAALLSALRLAGFPAQLSRNAGRYLCNALYYWSLAEAGRDGPPVCFIHMPAFGMEGAVKTCLTFEAAAAGAGVLVRSSAQAVLFAGRKIIGGAGEHGSHESQAFHRARRNGRRVIRCECR